MSAVLKRSRIRSSFSKPSRSQRSRPRTRVSVHRAAPNGARPIRSTAHNYNLGESSGTTVTNSGTLSIPWTQIGSEIIDPTNDVSLHLLQATGIDGYGAAQFNFCVECAR